MNVIKKTRRTSNKTPDERMAYLVIVIVQEGNNKQFRVCLMSQNKAVDKGGGAWGGLSPPNFSMRIILNLSPYQV